MPLAEDTLYRSRLSGNEVEDPRTLSFLEAFGGFYKQLVQGTRCTGPDVLAINERFVEIDLSGEFPPERREAQVDFLVPQFPQSVHKRSHGIEMTPDFYPPSTCARTRPPQSVHHL